MLARLWREVFASCWVLSVILEKGGFACSLLPASFLPSSFLPVNNKGQRMVNYSELLQVLVSCLDASLEALTPPHPNPLPAQICGVSESFCFRSSVNRQQAAIGGKQLAGVHPKALFLSAWDLSGSATALRAPGPGSISKQEPQSHAQSGSHSWGFLEGSWWVPYPT